MQLDTHTVTSVALAVACVVAVAAAADGVDSLSTDPEELVDPNYGQLPAGEGELETLRDEVRSERRGENTAVADASADDGESSDSGEQEQVQVEAPSDSGGQAESADQRESQDGSAAEQQERDQSESNRDEASSDPQGSQAPPEPPDPFDWRALLAALALLAAAVAIAYRCRDRFRADDEGAGAEAAFADADPDSEVERAWLALVRRVDADRPEARTPREWAAAAVASGFDGDAVGTLTEAFETVRYGDGGPTDERTREVRRALDRLDALPRETDGGRVEPDGGEAADGEGDR